MILAYYSSVRMVAVGLETAASIWFEIWGSWIRVKKIHFSRQISDKFRFFPGKFSKNFDFSSKKILITFLVIYSKISLYPEDKFVIYS